jgi:hypothetical protein
MQLPDREGADHERCGAIPDPIWPAKYPVHELCGDREISATALRDIRELKIKGANAVATSWAAGLRIHLPNIATADRLHRSAFLSDPIKVRNMFRWRAPIG